MRSQCGVALGADHGSENSDHASSQMAPSQRMVRDYANEPESASSARPGRHRIVTEPPDRLVSIVSAFPQKRRLGLGDAILDEYLSGDCHRISPEAPVPVIRVSKVRRVLGGAANTAANVSALGGQARLVALLGQDEAGATLAEC